MDIRILWIIIIGSVIVTAINIATIRLNLKMAKRRKEMIEILRKAKTK